MSAEQAVGTYFVRQFRAISDEFDKVSQLPYWQAAESMERSWRELLAREPQAADNPLIHALLTAGLENSRLVYGMPSAIRARYQVARIERYIALLRTIEALRDYAARHDGQPPERLEQVTDLPVPVDPITGWPFDYRADGQTAVLNAPAPAGMSLRSGWRYELMFLKSAK
jgi:hypothetical protein